MRRRMGQLRLGTVRRAGRLYSFRAFIFCIDALAPRAWLVLSNLVSQFLELASKGAACKWAPLCHTHTPVYHFLL